jgi:hypothetical protein
MRTTILVMTIGVLLFVSGSSAARPTGRDQTVKAAAHAAERPVYLVFYWRARPGKTAEYSDYIRTVAEPIDDNARKAGVFEEVHTYTPAIATGAPGADWTHMRVFRLRAYAALDAFSQGMDDATKRVVPDAAQRARNSQHAAELRDLVRQEIWQDFR